MKNSKYQIQAVLTAITAGLLGLLLSTIEGRAQFGGEGRFGNNGNNNNNAGGLQAATKVTVVADEFSNSLIVLAPEPYQESIATLVSQLDVAVQDITELRVFHLVNSDPVEMAQVLNSLFEDEETTTNGQGPRGPGFFFGGRGGRGNNQAQDESDRSRRQSKVLAVADPRTSSVIVSASRNLMDQIAPMIASLDASTSRKQKVFVYSLENADVQEVEVILRNLFETQNTRNNRNTQTSQQDNALTQRANNAARNQGTLNTSGFGDLGGAGNGAGGLGGGP